MRWYNGQEAAEGKHVTLESPKVALMGLGRLNLDPGETGKIEVTLSEPTRICYGLLLSDPANSPVIPEFLDEVGGSLTIAAGGVMVVQVRNPLTIPVRVALSAGGLALGNGTTTTTESKKDVFEVTTPQSQQAAPVVATAPVTGSTPDAKAARKAALVAAILSTDFKNSWSVVGYENGTVTLACSLDGAKISIDPGPAWAIRVTVGTSLITITKDGKVTTALTTAPATLAPAPTSTPVPVAPIVTGVVTGVVMDTPMDAEGFANYVAGLKG